MVEISILVAVMFAICGVTFLASKGFNSEPVVKEVLADSKEKNVLLLRSRASKSNEAFDLLLEYSAIQSETDPLKRIEALAAWQVKQRAWHKYVQLQAGHENQIVGSHC